MARTWSVTVLKKGIHESVLFCKSGHNALSLRVTLFENGDPNCDFDVPRCEIRHLDEGSGQLLENTFLHIVITT